MGNESVTPGSHYRDSQLYGTQNHVKMVLYSETDSFICALVIVMLSCAMHNDNLYSAVRIFFYYFNHIWKIKSDTNKDFLPIFFCL